MEIQTVGVAGMGAMGILYADFFTRALGQERVFVLADAARIDRYRREGFWCNGQPCHFQYADPAELKAPVDLLVVAVKYNALPSLIQEIAPAVGPDTILISLLNGITSEEDLRAAFGDAQIIDCTVGKLASVKVGNHVECQGIGEMSVGDSSGRRQAQLHRLVRFLESAGVPYVVPEDMERQRWSKLLCNVGCNQAATVFQGNYGTLQRPGPARDTMIAAMEETVAVANARGIALTPQDVTDWVAVIDGLPPEAEPSMRQDSRARRPSEVELFAGTIRRLGREANVPTPVNDWIYQQVQELEAHYA